MTRQSLEILICRDMDGESWMKADSTVKCSADGFLYFIASGLAASIILIMTLGFPLIMYRLLYRQRNQIKSLSEIEELVRKEKEDETLHNAEEFLQSRFLRRSLLVRPLESIHCGYASDFFYFELVEMFRKLLLCVGFGMFWPESQIQAYMMILIQFMFTLIHHKYVYEICPDDEESSNSSSSNFFEFSHVATLHVISMLFYIFDLFAATLYMKFPASLTEEDDISNIFDSFNPPHLDQYFGLLLIVSNSLFLLSTIWMMISIAFNTSWCRGLYSRYDPKTRSLQQAVRRKNVKKKSSGTSE